MIRLYPTESFYALGVPATDARQIKNLFRVKHREPGKPVALIAASIKQVKQYFFVSKDEERLMRQHWPGALTIVLRPRARIAARALGARRIGVRVPGHAGARRLATQLGTPLTATSANPSGQPPTKSARKVKQLFPDILLVPGRCGRQRRPSTVVEIVRHRLVIHRQGSAHV